MSRSAVGGAGGAAAGTPSEGPHRGRVRRRAAGERRPGQDRRLGGARGREPVRDVAPVLEQDVCEERVGHDPARPRVSVDRRRPGMVQVPVVGHLVVVEDHERRHGRQQAPDLGQRGPEPPAGVAHRVPARLVEPGRRVELGVHLRPGREGGRPQDVGPGQEVLRVILADPPQVVGHRAGGEPERLTRALPSTQRRQGPERRGLVDAHEVRRDPADPRRDRRGVLVRVDLVARQQEEVRARIRRVGRDALGDGVRGEGQAVQLPAVDLAAARVHDDEVGKGRRDAAESRPGGAEGEVRPGRLRGPARGRGAVLVERPGGELAGGPRRGEHREPQVDPHLGRRAGRRDLRGWLTHGPDVQDHVGRPGQREPHGHGRAGQPAQDRSGKDGWQRGDAERDAVDGQRPTSETGRS